MGLLPHQSTKRKGQLSPPLLYHKTNNFYLAGVMVVLPFARNG